MHGLHAALAAALLAALAGCGFEPRWTLDAPQFYPVAIDYWPEGKAFLVGGYHDGTILALGTGGAVHDGSFIGRHADGRKRALRLKVDAARARLWVLDTEALYVYALPQRSLLARIALPPLTPTAAACLPDLTLDPAGAAYVSDNRRPVLYRVDEASLQMRVLTVRFPDAAAPPGGFSALLYLEDTGGILAGSADSGRLWVVDAGEGAARPVALSRGIMGICGLSGTPQPPAPYGHLRPAGPRVYAAAGFHDEVVQIQLSADLRHGSVRQIAPFVKTGVPVSIAAFGNHLLVTGSQLTHHGDFGGRHAPLLPFRIVVMPRKLESMSTIEK